MGAMQIMMIVWLSVNLLASAYMHGKEKEGKHNFWSDFATILLFFSLLYFGDYFN